MRRGFTSVELLISLAITSLLLTGLFGGLVASVNAYSRSSADGVNRLTSRLLIERIALLVRTGTSFGPMPASATINEIQSDYLEITTPSGQLVTITWDSVLETLEMDVDGTSSTVLGGVTQDIGGPLITPFLLQYENGLSVQRVTINLAVVPDESYKTAMDNSEGEIVRLTTSVMPRAQLY